MLLTEVTWPWLSILRLSQEPVEPLLDHSCVAWVVRLNAESTAAVTNLEIIVKTQDELILLGGKECRKDKEVYTTP